MFKKLRESMKMRKIEKKALLENMSSEGRSLLESNVIFGATPEVLKPIILEEKDEEISDTVDDNGDLIDDKDNKDNDNKEKEAKDKNNKDSDED